MPKLSEFYGIKITMYADEHGVPHFHAHYEGLTVVVGIQPITILAGSIRGRGLAMVMEWAAEHQGELLAAWAALQSGGKPNKIEPLD
jgi:hypothetical protein